MLELRLQPVPKMLGMLGAWCPEAMKIGFKLETDARVLEHKATQSLHRYGLSAVVANLLQTRADEVFVYDAGGASVVRRQGAPPLEVALVSELSMRHQAWIATRLSATM